jgi:hypothetical protein
MRGGNTPTVLARYVTEVSTFEIHCLEKLVSAKKHVVALALHSRGSHSFRIPSNSTSQKRGRMFCIRQAYTIPLLIVLDKSIGINIA